MKNTRENVIKLLDAMLENRLDLIQSEEARGGKDTEFIANETAEMSILWNVREILRDNCYFQGMAHIYLKEDETK